MLKKPILSSRVHPHEIVPTNPLDPLDPLDHPAPGDYFGETALVQKAPRNATVVAMGDVRLRLLSHEQFEEFDLHRKLQLEVRHANMKTGGFWGWEWMTMIPNSWMMDDDI